MKRRIRLTAAGLIVLLVIGFVGISQNRFENDISYQNKIPLYSKVQSVVLYNYIDYISQWYNNSLEVLDHYHSETLKGYGTFSPILDILKEFHVVEDYSIDFMKLRQHLMRDKWYTFNGLVANLVYDFGYIFSILLALLYNFIIRKLKPDNNRLSINSSFILVLLIQIPLMAIFYSFFGGIVIALLFYIPIHIYLRLDNIKSS